MQRYIITLEYDGTNYYGWQLQPELPSITGALQEAFYKTFKHTITITGASRTDAGVHARGQVATFATDLSITPEKLVAGWNNSLPADIVIRTVTPVEPNYNIFDRILAKTYTYHIFLSRPSPLWQRYGWHYQKTFNLEKLRHTFQQIVGTHDFTSLCAADAPDPNKIRTIESISISYESAWDALKITVRGPRFLRHMIRRIVGGALKIASDPKISVDYMQEILRARNPNNRLPTAPAHGLLLHNIEYLKG